VFPRGMRVEIESDDNILFVESEKPITVNEVLRKLEIQTSTVLVVYDGKIVPHTSLIESDIRLELVVVSSGG
jgi:sulfur carrier protein ThiS